MWETWKLICEYCRRSVYCDPDNFGMYIYNDFNGYGLQELIENFLVVFQTELKKKQDENTPKQLWAIAAGLAHWLNVDQLDAWFGQDDGERTRDTVDLIGLVCLTALNALDQAGLLKADSEIKDLGLVMSLYLRWSADLEDYGIEADWRKDVVAYAKKGNVDLKATGCFGTEHEIELLEEENGEIAALSGPVKADRWGLKTKFTKYSKGCPKSRMGGSEYDITKWSRKERAKHAFDKKDPLADVSEKDLKEGRLMLG